MNVSHRPEAFSIVFHVFLDHLTIVQISFEMMLMFMSAVRSCCTCFNITYFLGNICILLNAFNREVVLWVLPDTTVTYRLDMVRIPVRI